MRSAIEKIHRCCRGAARLIHALRRQLVDDRELYIANISCTLQLTDFNRSNCDMPWNNTIIQLFHGTNTDALGLPATTLRHAMPPFVVSLAKCKRASDFGRGFYTTTSEHQAREWANASVRKILAVRPGSAIRAIVLQFNVRFESLSQAETLSFVRGTLDFHDLVSYCRSGRRGHNRSPPQKSFYDVVCGPVSIGLQKLVIQDADQVSFHDQRIAQRLLRNPRVADVGTLPDGLF